MSTLIYKDMNEQYKEITDILISAFKNFKPKKKDSINSILNKLTYIEKKHFQRYDEDKNEYVFNIIEYNIALDNQKKQIEVLSEQIKENPLNTLSILFKHNQILFFRIRVNGENKNIFHRQMTVEYLLENSIIQNKEYKENLIIVFNELIKKYINMENSMMKLEDNKFCNQTIIKDDNNKEDIFEQKLKYVNKLKQDLLLVFILYRNKVINKTHINKFINNYLLSFKKVINIEPKSNLEEENIKVWASGVRFIEVLAENFKYSNKYTKECFEYKKVIDKLCPSLRFM